MLMTLPMALQPCPQERARWGGEEGHMAFLPHLEEEDKEVEADKRATREVVRMGNSLSPMIQLKGTDCR